MIFLFQKCDESYNLELCAATVHIRLIIPSLSQHPNQSRYEMQRIPRYEMQQIPRYEMQQIPGTYCTRPAKLRHER